MLKKIIYCIRQFFNVVCVSSGIACFLTVITDKNLSDEMGYIIGGIGVLSIVYGANKIIELYVKQNKE